MLPGNVAALAFLSAIETAIGRFANRLPSAHFEGYKNNIRKGDAASVEVNVPLAVSELERAVENPWANEEVSNLIQSVVFGELSLSGPDERREACLLLARYVGGTFKDKMREWSKALG